MTTTKPILTETDWATSWSWGNIRFVLKHSLNHAPKNYEHYVSAQNGTNNYGNLIEHLRTTLTRERHTFLASVLEKPR